MHDIRYDAVHDEIIVVNPFAQAILTFRGAANGQEKPVRVIQGPHTRFGTSASGRVEVDPIHNEILLPHGDKILAYPRTAEGDVAPIRVIQGPQTGLDRNRTQNLAVDAVHDLLITGTLTRDEQGGLQIFRRTDQGDVAPQRVIRGANTGLHWQGQIQVYPPKGWIVVSQQGRDPSDPEPDDVFIGIWSIHDNGDVAPRWKIGGPKSILKKPRGIALNPRAKELIVADMTLNAVLTYYFAEMF